MRGGAFLLAAALAGCATVGGSESEIAICNSLEELSETAISRNSQVTATVTKKPQSIVCGNTSDEAVSSYCEGVIPNTSIEFINFYPMAVRSCLKSRGRLTAQETSDDWSGVKGRRGRKIVELEGTLKTGAHIRMRFTPYEDENPENYYGEYELTVAPR